MSYDRRLSSFLFNPREFLNDPVVAAMTLEETGAYIRMLCAAWDSPVVGVLSANERVLMRAAGCTAEEWERVALQVSKAFEIDPESDTWEQKRMIREWNTQLDKTEKYRERKNRWRETLKGRGQDGDRTRTRRGRNAPGTACPPLGVGVGVGVVVENLEPKTSSPDGDAMFHLFWDDYPRKTAKQAALKSWRAMLKRNPHLDTKGIGITAVFSGLDRWCAHWITQKTEAGFIPHASTWLNQDRWNEVPA